jgi:hypothetical protein
MSGQGTVRSTVEMSTLACAHRSVCNVCSCNNLCRHQMNTKPTETRRLAVFRRSHCFHLPGEINGIQPPEIRGDLMSETATAITQVDAVSEKRLWQAVLLTTIQDWISGPLRRKRQAEEYLFQDQKDFETVCKSAGMDPDQLRSKLRKLRMRMLTSPLPGIPS